MGTPRLTGYPASPAGAPARAQPRIMPGYARARLAGTGRRARRYGMRARIEYEVEPIIEIHQQVVDLCTLHGRHCCVGRSQMAGDWWGDARRTASAFAGFRFPPEVISVAVRWYLRYGLSYRDVEELLAERGITVDHVTIYRWVQRFTAEFIEAARPCRHVPGDRWFADET
jgi:hypothetical protein